MLYVAFLIFNAIEMFWESRISAQNSVALLARGAKEIAPRILPVMASIYLVMYVGSFFEFVLAQRALPRWWLGLFMSLFVLAKLLKFWAVRSLGPFWTMRVLVVPGTSVVKTGPYRYIRHPNYIAVLLELAATPLLGKAFYTAGIVLASFSVALYFRIRAEETALSQLTDYEKAAAAGRFIP